MSKTERVTLTGPHEHTRQEEDGREHTHVFAAGTHSLPAAVAQAARDKGLVADEDRNQAPAPVRAARKPAAKPRVRKARSAAKAKA